LLPQHFTPPALVSAQVWPPPAVIAVTPLARPVTSTGVLLSVVVPLPSWPAPLAPQHLTPPPLVSAHVWLEPAEIAVIAGLTAGGGDVGGGVVTRLAADGAEVGGGGGEVAGGGLAGDAQADTSSPTTIVVATRSNEERIPGPPDGVSAETFGDARCYLDRFAPVIVIRQRRPPRAGRGSAMIARSGVLLGPVQKGTSLRVPIAESGRVFDGSGLIRSIA
jgi:hypothetical protein